MDGRDKPGHDELRESLQAKLDPATVCELLAASLDAWRLDGCVSVDAADGSIHVSCRGTDIRIERASKELPFRWMVAVDGRKRGAISLVAVLRQVRSALDPAYAANRLRVAAAPLVPS